MAIFNGQIKITDWTIWEIWVVLSVFPDLRNVAADIYSFVHTIRQICHTTIISVGSRCNNDRRAVKTQSHPLVPHEAESMTTTIPVRPNGINGSPVIL